MDSGQSQVLHTHMNKVDDDAATSTQELLWVAGIILLSYW